MSEEKFLLSDSLIPRLQQTLLTCSQLIDAGDFSNSNELVDFLSPISVSVVEETSNPDLERTSFEILTEIDCFISSPSRNQEVIDALSFELPKVVCKFACASKRCSEIAERVVGHLVSMCSPREMLSILCEALSLPSEMFRVPCYFAPLIGGLAKVENSSSVPIMLNNAIQNRSVNLVSQSFTISSGTPKFFTTNLQNNSAAISEEQRVGAAMKIAYFENL
ncbi:putative prolyl endopeptidase-like [Capsicum annuum]|uniref:Uncharacterized protein n=1 Tax=Capsicum annuum TaxID=4072 RepID=A0A2G2YX00_CAPAN|nr:putative prolyl endopeptidase-like [Capsicum annuum]KAF3648900.1 putative prolyl endopeptidase-like [Capsicum annuum]PHT74264.1 hypothetical protein T459_21541 [Capsicum annuum]